MSVPLPRHRSAPPRERWLVSAAVVVLVVVPSLPAALFSPGASAAGDSTAAAVLPPISSGPCPKATPVAAPTRTSCLESGPRTLSTERRCFRKTIDLIARAGGSHDVVVRATLSVLWCARTRVVIIRIAPKHAASGFHGLTAAGPQRVKIRRSGHTRAFADTDVHVTGTPDADVYAAATAGAVRPGRKRLAAGTPVDEHVKLHLTVNGNGRASASCAGTFVACRVTPRDR